MSLASRISDFVSAVAADIKSLRDGKANSTHAHTISDVTGLTGALDGKMNSDGFGAYGEWDITASIANSLSFADTRDVAPQPNEVPGYQSSFEFKLATSVGNPPIQAGGGFAWIQTIHGWGSDGSGGWPIQLSWSGDGLAIRQGLSSTTWKPWQTFAIGSGGSGGTEIAFSPTPPAAPELNQLWIQT